MKWIYAILFKILVKEKSNFNEVKWVEDFLKRQGFVGYGNMYTKDFTVVMVYKENGQITHITIGHDMNFKHQKITQHFATSLAIAVNYYNRTK